MLRDQISKLEMTFKEELGINYKIGYFNPKSSARKLLDVFNVIYGKECILFRNRRRKKVKMYEVENW